ncbi:MAG: hypothetical protein JG782_1445 [Anaerophaga sp.]|uniref:hypothetical protein n=1 Tax=Anaerophaga thermohalophila TaxID=177400 RepID=UPI000237D1C7|nr:hypothetical protein [Anaerophaga thermohalophila]MBZ4676825.1 hypothetical protein [Anaerophaga sp.]MDI3520452.1 hypothetical protein [Anaerophaga sp.]MDK2842165.1 hypothetical protein [Anaerophaga sp.]MDN5290958.1 hypothetical protein [Anaerophaga sp.]
MNKKNIILVMVFTLAQVFFISGNAQEEESRLERLKSQKVAFLTERIGLSTEDAQKFWPVYNEMSEKMDELWKEKKENIKKLYHSDESLSEAGKEAAIDEYINYELKKANLEKEYHEKFKKILTIDQVIKLYGAEHEFKKKMLHMIKGGKSSSCTDCDNDNEPDKMPSKT